jgi:hypothetical protein
MARRGNTLSPGMICRSLFPGMRLSRAALRSNSGPQIHRSRVLGRAFVQVAGVGALAAVGVGAATAGKEGEACSRARSGGHVTA